MNWTDAVKAALQRYSTTHATIQIDRTAFLREQLPQIVHDTSSTGKTPHQTVSRVLQELRDAGALYFSSSGKYVLNGIQLDVVAEDAPEDVLENAARHGGLTLKDVAVSDAVGEIRIRRGVGALRSATLANYQHRCALCDICEASLLVTSHIARWADRPEARGLLANTICFCSLHDRLFEHGFFTLSEAYRVVCRPNIASRSISTWLTTCTTPFAVPQVLPAPLYLKEHQERTGLRC